ncbi:MAG: hypothetical protein GKR89_34045 [Candidatus Latescibacteria bacterium]|nr:hypothetical protein [Candidatus Latescibacterota bacterium]
MSIEGEEMKKITILAGSASDLQQTRDGLAFLKEAYGSEFEQQVTLHVLSCHRNLWELFHLSFKLDADVIIAGAGWAAALPGIANAIVNGLLSKGIPVIGVGFDAAADLPARQDKDEAARLSITELPGNPVHYAGMGSDGFLAAAKMAVESDLPTPKTGSSKDPMHDVDLNKLLETGAVVAK